MRHHGLVAAVGLAALLVSGGAMPACSEAGGKSVNAEKLAEVYQDVLNSFRDRVEEARASGSKPRERAALIGLAASLEWANATSLGTPPEEFLDEKVEVYRELAELEAAQGNAEEAAHYRSLRESLCSGWDLERC